MPQRSRALPALSGVRCLFRAVAFLRANRAAWRYCWAPPVVFAVLFGLTLYGCLTLALAPLLANLPVPEFGAGALRLVASLAGYLVSILIALTLAYLLATPLSSPALEALVAMVESTEGLPARRPLGFVGELMCGFRAQTLALCFLGPLSVVLWLISWLAPVLAVVLAPLGTLLSGLMLAWTLFDYPLTLWGVAVGQRVALVRKHFLVVATFGVAFAVPCSLPLMALFLLPVGVVAAALLLIELRRLEPAAFGDG